MRVTRIALLAALLAGFLAGAGHAATSVSAGIHIGSGGRASVDLGFFYDDLARYGHWMQRPQYGWVWTPRAAAVSWRPYQQGHWVWTDYGWTWISQEPFGWATYHYGRWYDDPDYGWEWIPGNDWGPAWVDWHASNDYVGWAPLPPSYDVSRPSGISLGFADYVFVPERFFLSARVNSYAAAYRDRERIYGQGRSYTSYRRFNGGYFNEGLPVDQIQRAVGRRVTRYQVGDLAPSRRFSGARIARNRVEVFRPQVQQGDVAPPPSRKIARRAVVSAADTRALASRHANRRQMEARQQGQQEHQVSPKQRQVQQKDRAVHKAKPPVQKQRQVRQQKRTVREVKPPAQKQRQVRQNQAVREVKPPAQKQRQVQQKDRAVHKAKPPVQKERQVRQQKRTVREVKPPAQGGGHGKAPTKGKQDKQKHGHGGPP